MNAGNIRSVAETLRDRYPYTIIVITADNDQFTEGNPGLTKAREAANDSICYLTWPEFGEDDLDGKPTDFNDYFQIYGKGKTVSTLKRLEKPDSSIEIQEGKLPEMVDLAEQHLILLDGNIYQFGGILVRPQDRKGYQGSRHIFQEVTTSNLQERLTKVCS